MLATIQQNSNGVYQAAPGWSVRPGHANKAGTVAGRAANAVALIGYRCSDSHLSLLCYPLPGTDRESSRQPIGRSSEGPGDLHAKAWRARSRCAGWRFSGTLLRDGPPRMVARSTWSGREGSSHSRFLPVPRVGLVTFAFFCFFQHSVLRRFLPVALANP